MLPRRVRKELAGIVGKGNLKVEPAELALYGYDATPQAEVCPPDAVVLPRPHWCLDAIRAQRFWGAQQYHYTAPVPGILAIHEALRLICEETLERRFKRHALSSDALQAGIEAMGLELYVEKAHRLNSVVAIRLPDGHDGIEVRRNMSDVYGVEIAGAFGLPVVRVGQMGEQCRSHNLFKVLYALGMSFRRAGAELDVSRGMAALEGHLAKDLDQLIG